MGKIWSSSITVEIDELTSTFAHICSTRDAAQYLLDCWTVERSQNYKAAVRFCAKALRGEMSHEAAYISVMAALREAQIVVVVDRRREDSDPLEIEMQHAVAESVLAELRQFPP